MGIGDRLFEPPGPDAAKVAARLARLTPELQDLLARAGQALEGDDVSAADHALQRALALAPSDVDVLRMHGLALAQAGDSRAALQSFAAALRAAPDDAVTFWQYARACEDASDVGTAFDLRRRAIESAPRSPLAWADLGEHLLTYASASAAIVPLERAVGLAPRFDPALLKLGHAYVECGRIEDGAHCFRAAIAAHPEFVPAWSALVDIKTLRLSAAELAQMRDLLSATSALMPGERIALQYALAQACEYAGLYDEAWRRVVDANALRRQELPAWDRARFIQQERSAARLFAQPGVSARDPTLGKEVIFIVGLPRSGTTLIEQILAAHPDVEGAGELAVLPNVLTEESGRVQRRYPEWVKDADAGDWQRLGERYLALTSGLRAHRSRSTDKLPGNWRALGAIRAMLPGARVVVCRRDPLENCWSCFKQYFPHGSDFTNDIADLALFWHAFDSSAARWATDAPTRVRQQSYEYLTTHAETEIRALLDFCDLPFDPACLRPHELRRSVRTVSAAQVREPIHPHRGIAAAYGALINPLRVALGIPALDTAPDASDPATRSNPSK